MRSILGMSMGVGAIAASAALGEKGNILSSYDAACPHTRLAKMPHFTPERPLTKRQRRRLRGKASS